MEKRGVLLVGRSLLLAGVAASLRECAGLRVAIAATWGETDPLLADGIPQVVIVDLADASDSRLLKLLLQTPRLVVIGLDTEHNQAMFVSGREVRALTMNRIKEIAQASEVR